MAKKSGDSFLAGFPSPPPGQMWPSTHWSLIHKAQESKTDRKEALDELLTNYYKPVARFFQKVLGIRGDTLRDVTQEFFTRFIDKDFLKNLHYEKSFRNFLKVACRRHYINWIEKHHGGKIKPKFVSPTDSQGSTFDIPMPEKKFDTLFDEELCGWYLEQAVDILQSTLMKQGKKIYWEVFQERVRFDGEKPTDYKTLSKKLNISVYTVRNHLTAARKIFRKALLDLAKARNEDPKRELRDLGLLKFVS